ncbi:hypothetical protein [Mesorhizobium sp.]|uniref:hypothetical protein n=1 Tax=Mesorhizobium sp. TaxID=1871066 RepID=UPI00121CB4D9|nr:hypothetical protein [Mesorhizobium sp.]TIQ42698.1 MAG: hypothetical protein E5X47_31580 [Mesorhizobium sp.]TIQ56499.1 MAG: hypothetical protein E5X46_18665 [Mesorhizobium sp.]
MRSIARTATVIASIALAIVLTFMAAKGFELGEQTPVSHVATMSHRVADSAWKSPEMRGNELQHARHENRSNCQVGDLLKV